MSVRLVITEANTDTDHLQFQVQQQQGGPNKPESLTSEVHDGKAGSQKEIKRSAASRLKPRGDIGNVSLSSLFFRVSVGDRGDSHTRWAKRQTISITYRYTILITLIALIVRSS